MSATAGPRSGLTSSSTEACSAEAPTPVNHCSGAGCGARPWRRRRRTGRRPARPPGRPSACSTTGLRVATRRGRPSTGEGVLGRPPDGDVARLAGGAGDRHRAGAGQRGRAHQRGPGQRHLGRRAARGVVVDAGAPAPARPRSPAGSPRPARRGSSRTRRRRPGTAARRPRLGAGLSHRVASVRWAAGQDQGEQDGRDAWTTSSTTRGQVVRPVDAVGVQRAGPPARRGWTGPRRWPGPARRSRPGRRRRRRRRATAARRTRCRARPRAATTSRRGPRDQRAHRASVKSASSSARARISSSPSVFPSPRRIR